MPSASKFPAIPQWPETQATPPRDTPYRRDVDQYHNEIASYLAKVKNGRSVVRPNPLDPRFSQEADDARIAKKMGLGHLVQTGPPKLSASIDAPPPSTSTPPTPSSPAASPPGDTAQAPFLWTALMDLLRHWNMGVTTGTPTKVKP